MADAPWLTLIGLGEDGAAGLSRAARAALDGAEVVTGAARHLALLPGLKARTQAWPVPFVDGIPALLALRGQRVAMLVSGDPFWFGAGSVIARHLDATEWIAHPAPSTFSLAAARLGWPIEGTACLGLHAAPFARLRPVLAEGTRAIALLRDGAAAEVLAAWLTAQGFGGSTLHVLEALGGPRERWRRTVAERFDLADVGHPIAVGIECTGGPAVPRASGLADDWFAHDGQITKRPVRALTLSALAPRPGEMLWDIGAGSGSIGIEWLLAHPTTQATAFEGNPDRAARIRANADRLGVDRLAIIEGRAPDVVPDAPLPNAIFIGGGLSAALLERLFVRAAGHSRLVANAVTLESEALLAAWHERMGGSLMRIELAEAQPIGKRRGWRAAYPVVQWSVTL